MRQNLDQLSDYEIFMTNLVDLGALISAHYAVSTFSLNVYYLALAAMNES